MIKRTFVHARGVEPRMYYVRKFYRLPARPLAYMLTSPKTRIKIRLSKDSVAGMGIEPMRQGYEPRDLPLVYPAIPTPKGRLKN